ncbi:MAG: cytochrome c oxidase accessory protein CcoG [Gemmatimonadota bacterium]
MTGVKAPGRVLSTLNSDGSRRWLRPKLSDGRFWQRRRVVAYALMFVFFIIPYLRMNGKPLILLDILHRHFVIFGTTFLPTDTLLFMLLFVSVGLAIFLVTALFGRAWCGWACPQTVYMEFIFRPLERLIEGGRSGSLGLDKQGRRLKPRRVLKYAVYGVLSLFLAHTFLAYFVGIDQLVHWVRTPPSEHPTAFLVMAGTAGAIFFDFTYFREQTCIVACPYGRLQSVLLDRQSIIVGYDPIRGEPRGMGVKDRPATAGDCIDCGACVLTCPTGIDIREGLQMECIHCTQCVDACDDIMDKVGKPRGLIRYSSRAVLEGAAPKRFRPRVVIYPAALLVSVGILAFFLLSRPDTDVTLLRGIGTPYSFQADGRVVNQIRVKVTNRGTTTRRYRIELSGADGAEVVSPENPLEVAPGAVRSTSLFVVVSRSAFHDGQRPVIFELSDGDAFQGAYPYNLVGPEHDNETPDSGVEPKEHRK